MKNIALMFLVAVTVGLAAAVALLVAVHPAADAALVPPAATFTEKHGDQELAYMLVKLELRTRSTMYADYTRRQSPVPGVDFIYRRWLAKNAILPAAVADRVYSEVVPGATGGRAWVKMVVQEPRNPHNIPDPTAQVLFEEIRSGAKTAEKQTTEAYYYAEPIKATEACMSCHGAPRGRPDPVFPEYRLEGWKAGTVIGAVVARVAPDSSPSTEAAVRKPGWR
jgi:hypothetical protein